MGYTYMYVKSISVASSTISTISDSDSSYSTSRDIVLYCGTLRLYSLPPVVVGGLARRGLLDGRVAALPAERRPPLLVLHAAPPVPLAFLAAILKLNRSSCN